MNKTLEEKEATIKIFLLKGVLYRDEQPEVWNDLLMYKNSIHDWFAQISLGIYTDEAEGHAFLEQKNWEEGDENALNVPSLIIRRNLSYQMSMLCVLLHKKLVEHDTHQSGPCIISKEEIVEMMKIYFTGQKNEARIVDDIGSYIKKMTMQMGFLRQLKEDDQKYEIRRIIKAFINAQNLANFNNLLKGVSHETEETV